MFKKGSACKNYTQKLPWNVKEQVNIAYWRENGWLDVQIWLEKGVLMCRIPGKKTGPHAKLDRVDSQHSYKLVIAYVYNPPGGHVTNVLIPCDELIKNVQWVWLYLLMTIVLGMDCMEVVNTDAATS